MMRPPSLLYARHTCRGSASTVLCSIAATAVACEGGTLGRGSCIVCVRRHAGHGAPLMLRCSTCSLAAAPGLASATTRCGLRCHDGHSEMMLQQSNRAGGASAPVGGALPGGRNERRPSGTLQRPALTGSLHAARCAQKHRETPTARVRACSRTSLHISMSRWLSPQSSTTTCAPYRVSAPRTRRKPPVDDGACMAVQNQPPSRGRRPAASAQGRRARSQCAACLCRRAQGRAGCGPAHMPGLQHRPADFDVGVHLRQDYLPRTAPETALLRHQLRLVYSQRRLSRPQHLRQHAAQQFVATRVLYRRRVAGCPGGRAWRACWISATVNANATSPLPAIASANAFSATLLLSMGTPLAKVSRSRVCAHHWHYLRSILTHGLSGSTKHACTMGARALACCVTAEQSGGGAPGTSPGPASGSSHWPRGPRRSA